MYNVNIKILANYWSGSRRVCRTCSYARFCPLATSIAVNPRPFQGRFFFGRVGRAVVSQCTEHEVSRFTRYEAVNGGAKCRKWGGLGVFKGHSRSWAMPPFDRAHTTSYSTLIETIRVYLLPFSRYRRLFVESRRF